MGRTAVGGQLDMEGCDWRGVWRRDGRRASPEGLRFDGISGSLRVMHSHPSADDKYVVALAAVSIKVFVCPGLEKGSRETSFESLPQKRSTICWKHVLTR